MKVLCSMSSQVLELIERARSGPQRKKGGADHPGSARSRWPTVRLDQGFIDRLPGYLSGLQQHGCTYQTPGGIVRACAKAEEPDWAMSWST